MLLPRRLRLPSVLAVVLTGAAALPAAALGAPTLVVGAGGGLTAPAGAVVTPNGETWIADATRGVCRVVPGASPAVADSQWCSAAASGEEGEPPAADAGPDSPLGLAFDAATGMFYVADGASPGGGVWRLQWDGTGDITGGQQIVTLTNTDDRVSALTLGPPAGVTDARALYFVMKRSAEIRRIDNPAGVAAGSSLAGTAAGRAADTAAIAATADALYVGGGGVHRHPVTAGSAGSGDPVAGLEPFTVTALAVDAGRNRLYAGTSQPDLQDRVLVHDLAQLVEPYELGFSGVTALGPDPGGDLLVADDPAWATGAQGSQGQGRLWRVALAPLGRPQTQITSAPPALSSSTTATFTYASSADARFECRLDAGVFSDCPGDGVGQTSYPSPVAEGRHEFSVRAVLDGVTGLPASHAFVIDRTAPRVTVIAPTGDFYEGGPAPRVRWEVDEAGVSFACSLDGGAFSPCHSGNPIENLSAGSHVLRVVGTDAAGNRSDPNAGGASVTLVIRSTESEPAASTPAVEQPAAPSPVAEPLPEGQVPVGGSSGREATPVLRSFRVRLQRDRRGIARRLRISLAVPGDARTLQILVTDRRNRRIVSRRIAVRPGRARTVSLRLTRAEQRRLRPGRYVVRGAFRTRRGTLGNVQKRQLRVPRR